MDEAEPIGDMLTLLVLVARRPNGVITYKRFGCPYLACARCAARGTVVLFAPSRLAQDVTLHSVVPAEYKRWKCSVCLAPC